MIRISKENVFAEIYPAPFFREIIVGENKKLPMLGLLECRFFEQILLSRRLLTTMRNAGVQIFLEHWGE